MDSQKATLVKKVTHYKPTGFAIFCRCVGALDYDTAVRDARKSTTDIRRVTCPLCLHAVAGSMIRKGVPIRFNGSGKHFYERFIPVPPPRCDEQPVDGGAA